MHFGDSKDVLFSNDGKRCWNDDPWLHYEGGIGNPSPELYVEWIIRTRQLHSLWQNRHPDPEWARIQRHLWCQHQWCLPWRCLITKAISSQESLWWDLSQPMEMYNDMPWRIAYPLARSLESSIIRRIVRWDLTTSCWLGKWFCINDK